MRINLSWEQSFWVTLAIAFVLLGLFIFMADKVDSEQAKRVELEGRLLALSGVAMAVKYGDRFTNEEYIRLAIKSAEQVGIGRIGSFRYMEVFDSLCQVVYRTSPDSLLAVPTKGETP